LRAQDAGVGHSVHCTSCRLSVVETRGGCVRITPGHG
jgi:hypothetical protein